jgi:hypothetical protein
MKVEDTPISTAEMQSFISTLAYLSFYQVTPTLFFSDIEAFPASLKCNDVVFKWILRGISKSAANDDLRMRWGRPFQAFSNTVKNQIIK